MSFHFYLCLRRKEEEQVEEEAEEVVLEVLVAMEVVGEEHWKTQVLLVSLLAGYCYCWMCFQKWTRYWTLGCLVIPEYQKSVHLVGEISNSDKRMAEAKLKSLSLLQQTSLLYSSFLSFIFFKSLLLAM